MIRATVLLSCLPALAGLAIASAALSSCAGQLTAPAEVAARTSIDEQAALAVELAYQAAAQAVLTADAAGLVQSTTRPCVRKLDQQAYEAVQAVRSGYSAVNAGTPAEALANARTSVMNFLTRKGC